MSLHDYGEDLALDLVLEDATYYIALCFDLPDDADDGSDIDEPSGGAYARQAIAPADWSAASGGVKRNSSVITFATATADWGTTPLKAWALCTASTGGEVIASGALGTSRRIYEGYSPYFPADSINCLMD